MKIPATIVTGFLGAGKTTLVRHVLTHAGGRRIAAVDKDHLNFGNVSEPGNAIFG